jgi:nitronate monooxygenase
MSQNRPIIIQGGMGIGVSNYHLANTVSRAGGLGVVSGSGLNSVLIRRLQDGDVNGDTRRALAAFPIQSVAQSILEKYFLPEGRKGAPYKRAPLFTHKLSQDVVEQTVVANFVEVWLAKEGHSGLVGLNLLEKIVMPNIPSLYGAMLAGVDYVLMGAGIPREIPGVLDKLANHEEAFLKLPTDGATSEDNFKINFNPRNYFELPSWTALKRPEFLAIVSSAVLALNLAKKSTGKVNGFVIEHWTAGGHNAPPRGTLQLDEIGQPIYGTRDEVDFAKFCELGLPFWLAGSCGSPEKVAEAVKLGAVGVQVGTAFAFSDESGLSESIKDSVRKRIQKGENVTVYTDPVASPSGFPFKVIEKQNTLFDKKVYESRPRKCDLGYLRSAYKKEDGTIGQRCASEPIDTYLKKGGKIEETVGRKCLCNGLFAAVDQAQLQDNGYIEDIIITAGDDLQSIKRFVKSSTHYSAAEVVKVLQAGASDVKTAVGIMKSVGTLSL